MLQREHVHVLTCPFLGVGVHVVVYSHAIIIVLSCLALFTDSLFLHCFSYIYIHTHGSSILFAFVCLPSLHAFLPCLLGVVMLFLPHIFLLPIIVVVEKVHSFLSAYFSVFNEIFLYSAHCSCLDIRHRAEE